MVYIMIMHLINDACEMGNESGWYCYTMQMNMGEGGQMYKDDTPRYKITCLILIFLVFMLQRWIPRTVVAWSHNKRLRLRGEEVLRTW